MNLVSQFTKVKFRQARVLKLINKSFRILLVHEELQLLNVTLIIGDAFAHHCYIVCKGRILRASFGINLLAAFRVRFDLSLEGLELTKVLILDLRVLNLYNVQLLLVLLARIPQSISELFCFLRVELLLISTVSTFGRANLINLRLKCLVLDLC